MNRLFFIMLATASMFFFGACGDSENACETNDDCESNLVCSKNECQQASANSGDNNGDDNNGDENNGDDNNGDTNNGDTNNGDTNNGDTNNGDGESCMGDFSIRESIFTNSGQTSIGAECDDPLQPKNCVDGLFTIFEGDQCVCTPGCKSYGLELGEKCDVDGRWTCQAVKGDGGSSAYMCAVNDWNLCQQ